MALWWVLVRTGFLRQQEAASFPSYPAYPAVERHLAGTMCGAGERAVQGDGAVWGAAKGGRLGAEGTHRSVAPDRRPAGWPRVAPP